MRRLDRFILIATTAALALTMAGCAKPASEPSVALPASAPATAVSTPTAPATMPTIPSEPATLAAGTTTASATVATPTPAPGKPISAASKRYAKDLGGWDYRGETLYFIVGGSFKSEAAATKTLKKVRPYFGDMQDYFIVQRSDNFTGMRPGWWVLIEGYRTKASAKQQMEFAQRAFTKAYIMKTVVNTSDPIPVYNDLVDFATP